MIIMPMQPPISASQDAASRFRAPQAPNVVRSSSDRGRIHNTARPWRAVLGRGPVGQPSEPGRAAAATSQGPTTKATHASQTDSDSAASSSRRPDTTLQRWILLVTGQPCFSSVVGHILGSPPWYG
jgi:hypothetical protein